MLCLLALQASALSAAEQVVASPPPAPVSPVRVVVIPVTGEIARPLLYIMRRGLKEAVEQHATAVVLDINTPGGEMDVTLDIMEALEKFPGLTIAYVDKEAMSAGAFISAASGEIYFAPGSVIGAAAPVSANGGDIDQTMKAKLVSYMKGKVRAVSEGKGFRGQVVSAMIDADYELKIGDKVIKPKGGLLTLTASEACATYGDPPQPLLGAGMADSLDALLRQKFGAQGFVIDRLEITWSERLAVWLNAAAPVLLGLGMLALFIEFKTPGFGVFGITGIALLGVVFLSSFVAGLSGHEPVLFFALGVLLVLLELVFWHTAGFLGVAGIALMLLSLLWAMADLWPNEPISVAWSADAFARPLLNLGLGFAIAVTLFAALLRYLPHGWIWDRLVVQATSGGTAQVAGGASAAAGELSGLIGQRGVATTALRPGGQVEVGGRRYEAMVEVGALDRGVAVIVTGCSDFSLTVERADS
ncbi:MAG: nodulation protein NfeD [Opitutales bacterium]